LNPQTINAKALAPQLQITDFKIGDVSLRPGQLPFIGGPGEPEKIKLRYQQNNFLSILQASTTAALMRTGTSSC
jgi:hypothetical protein